MNWRLWLDPNWSRLSRWCLIGAVVMLLWLLAPVAKCSWTAFREVPLSEQTPHGADAARPPKEEGFFSRWGTSISVCYKRTPLSGQEAWKYNALIGLSAAWLLLGLIGRFERSRKKPYTR